MTRSNASYGNGIWKKGTYPLPCSQLAPPAPHAGLSEGAASTNGSPHPGSTVASSVLLALAADLKLSMPLSAINTPSSSGNHPRVGSPYAPEEEIGIDTALQRTVGEFGRGQQLFYCLVLYMR